MALGVVVSHTTDADIQSGKRFSSEGLQMATGVPLQCDEGQDFQTLRVGLFGLEKGYNVDKTVAFLGHWIGLGWKRRCAKQFLAEVGFLWALTDKAIASGR